MIHGGQPQRTAPLCAFLIAVLVSIASAGAAQAGVIRIDWDRSSDPGVVGYRVSVGTAPGVYFQTFDVGSATSFTYQAPENREYYLAVASYAAGQVVGPLSAAVSATPYDLGSAPGDSPEAFSFFQSLWRAIGAAGLAPIDNVNGTPKATTRFSRIFRSTAPSVACWSTWSPALAGLPSPGCMTVRTLVNVTTTIDSLAASADGRLFFIEDGQRIRVVVSGALQPQAVVTSDTSAVRFTQLILDPAFVATGVAYVGESVSYPDGSREFRIVRYGIAANLIDDRSTLVRVPLPADGHALFAVASTGHIYVALPDADGQPGSLLRFNDDGTLPGDQAGSPVIATSYVEPTALTFDESAGRLWLAGVDEHNQTSISSLDGQTTPAAAGVVSLSATADATGSSLFLTSTLGSLGQAQAAADGSIVSSRQLLIGNEHARSVTVGASGELFVATASSILELTPAR